MCQVDIHSEYDLVQLIGEGWYSRVYLAEHRTTRDEVVLKAINSNLVTADEFCREYQSSINLWPHKNILKVKVVNEFSRNFHRIPSDSQTNASTNNTEGPLLRIL